MEMPENGKWKTLYAFQIISCTFYFGGPLRGVSLYIMCCLYDRDDISQSGSEGPKPRKTRKCDLSTHPIQRPSFKIMNQQQAYAYSYGAEGV